MVELGRRAALADGVTISGHEIDSVRATARIDGPTITGRLAPELIENVVRANFAELRKCYVQALTRVPDAAGKTATRLVIGRNGRVSEARTTLSGNLPPQMSSCLAIVFRSLTFEAPLEGIVTVSYPIAFSPGN